jgi:hypothetical protein
MTFYLSNSNKSGVYNNLAIFIVVFLSNIILLNSIEKFRGFNKLDIDEVKHINNIIVLIYISLFFFYKLICSFKKKVTRNFKIYVLTIVTITLSIIFAVISNFIFKETGYSLVFVPLIAGMIAGMMDLIEIKDKPVLEILQIILILVYPYAISGVLGVSLALLSGFLFTGLYRDNFSLDKLNSKNIIIAIVPLLFIIGISEIRENLGQITRFRLATGGQLGWILVSSLIF